MVTVPLAPAAGEARFRAYSPPAVGCGRSCARHTNAPCDAIGRVRGSGQAVALQPESSFHGDTTASTVYVASPDTLSVTGPGDAANP